LIFFLIAILIRFKFSQEDPTEENFETMLEFSKFYKRYILSKVYDPRYIGLKDGQAAHNLQSPYL